MSAATNSPNGRDVPTPSASDWLTLQAIIKETDIPGIKSWFDKFNVHDISPFFHVCQHFDPLCYAIKVNSEHLFDVLIEQGFPVDHWTNAKYTTYQPIHSASSLGRVNFMKKLIDDHNVPVDQLESRHKSQTPLSIALIRKQSEAVRFLVSRNANIQSKLIVAVQFSTVGIVEYLISAGAEVNHICPRWGSPLNMALIRGSSDLVKVLLGSGARTDLILRDGDTVLHTALIYIPNTRITGFLINANAPLNVQNNDGQTPVLKGLCRATLEDISKWLDVVLGAGYKVSKMDYDKACERFPASTIIQKLKFYLENPRTLRELCCFRIRSALGHLLIENVKCLPLSNVYKEYLKLSYLF